MDNKMDNKINKFILYLRKIIFSKSSESNDNFEDRLKYSINQQSINILDNYNIVSFDKYLKQNGWTQSYSTRTKFWHNLNYPLIKLMEEERGFLRNYDYSIRSRIDGEILDIINVKDSNSILDFESILLIYKKVTEN